MFDTTIDSTNADTTKGSPFLAEARSVRSMRRSICWPWAGEPLAEIDPEVAPSAADFVDHIANLADALLEHEDGRSPNSDSDNRPPIAEMQSDAALAACSRDVRARVAVWLDGPGQGAEQQNKAAVDDARQTLHEFRERTSWHPGQHFRQLVWMPRPSPACRCPSRSGSRFENGTRVRRRRPAHPSRRARARVRCAR